MKLKFPFRTQCSALSASENAARFSPNSAPLSCMAVSGLVLDWTRENPGAEELTPAKPLVAPTRFAACFLQQLASGSPHIQSSSQLLNHGSQGYNTSFTKPNNPHPLTAFGHCCYCNLFFQQQRNTAECLLCPALRIMAFFKAPKLFLGFS